MRTSTLLAGAAVVIACLVVSVTHFRILGKIVGIFQGEDDLKHSYSSFYDLSAPDIDGNEVILRVLVGGGERR